jgi:4-amino-4-deoxy-L-arabinose transferase-like glycosyltransferase
MQTSFWSARRFLMCLAGISLLGLGVRLGYALGVAPTLTPRADTVLYTVMAQGLARGYGYVSPASLFAGHPKPTSAYPPLYPLYLAGWAKLLGSDSINTFRAVSCLLGAATVFVIGLLGRRIGGVRTGLIAAGIAAVYPQLFMVDGTVITESIYAPLIALALLGAYRWIERPSPWRAALLGVAIGLAALARSEALLLLVLLVAPLAWRSRGMRLRTAAAALLATACVLAPWFARNWIVQHRPILLTNNTGFTALATNCPGTYYGKDLGFADQACAFDSPCARKSTETAASTCMLDAADDYIDRHLSRLPLVVLARIGRLWEVYGYHTDLGYGELWSRQLGVAKAGLAMYVLLLPLAAIGALLLRRRRVPLWPALVPFVLVTIVAALAFGFSRYRLAAEIPLVVLAAVCLERAPSLLRGFAVASARRGAPSRLARGADSPRAT